MTPGGCCAAPLECRVPACARIYGLHRLCSLLLLTAGVLKPGGGPSGPVERPPSTLRLEVHSTEGNFQHFRFIFAKGIRFAHRLYFLTG